jgi:hypothetical protein
MVETEDGEVPKAEVLFVPLMCGTDPGFADELDDLGRREVDPGRSGSDIW